MWHRSLRTYLTFSQLKLQPKAQKSDGKGRKRDRFRKGGAVIGGIRLDPVVLLVPRRHSSRCLIGSDAELASNLTLSLLCRRGDKLT